MTHRYFQIVAGADDASADDATELKWELDEDRVRCVVSFQLISSGAQSGRLGTYCIRGSLSLFGSVVDLDCILDDVMLSYVLCEVAIVSQLCISFLFSTWDV